MSPFNETTTFVIPTIGRDTLDRAKRSVNSTGARLLFQLDKQRLGEGTMRNDMIAKVTTPWVSFLDDDDIVLPFYVKALEKEIADHPEADVIHFKEYFEKGVLLPTWPKVEWGNVGISFSVKTEWARKVPFCNERHEDLLFIQQLEKAGANIHYSNYLTYLARPSF